MSSDIRDKIKSVLCRKYKQNKHACSQNQHPHKKQGENSNSSKQSEQSHSQQQVENLEQQEHKHKQETQQLQKHQQPQEHRQQQEQHQQQQELEPLEHQHDQQEQQQQQQLNRQQQNQQQQQQHEPETASHQTILLQTHTQSEESCSSGSTTIHNITKDDVTNISRKGNNGISSIQNVPTSAATLTTMSLAPPLMTSEHQTPSATETSITSALVTSPASSTLLLSSLGVLTTTSTADVDKDVAAAALALPKIVNDSCRHSESNAISTAGASGGENNVDYPMCTLPKLKNALCTKCKDGDVLPVDRSSCVGGNGGICVLPEQANELYKYSENEEKIQDVEREKDEETQLSLPGHETNKQCVSKSVQEAAETEEHEHRGIQNQTVQTHETQKEKFKQQDVETSRDVKHSFENSPQDAASGTEHRTACSDDINDLVATEILSQILDKNRLAAEFGAWVTENKMVTSEGDDICARTELSFQSENDTNEDGAEVASNQQEFKACERSLLGSNCKKENEVSSLNTEMKNVLANVVGCDTGDEVSLECKHKNESTAEEVSGSSSSNGVDDSLVAEGKDGERLPSIEVWDEGERFKSPANAELDKGEAVLLDSDDDMVGDDENDDDEDKDKGDKHKEGGGSDESTANKQESNVHVRSPTETAVGPNGLMDVYRLQKELDHGHKQMNEEFDQYRDNEKAIQRLCADIKDLKREISHVKGLNDRSKNTIKVLQEEVNTQRGSLTSACDSKSSTSKTDAQFQRLERKCYRDYYNMKDEKDAKTLLDTIRDKVKSLNRLETLVHRKRLVLKHALPVTLKEASPMKIPVAKKTRKLLDFTKGGAGNNRTSARTTPVNPVVVEILSCLADSGSTSLMTASSTSSSQHASTYSQTGVTRLVGGTPTQSTLSATSDDVSMFTRVVRRHQGTPVD